MAEIPSQARVVIIGGGVVGASALYHLCKAGWTDCVLLEKNELTAGSTWHASGNIPNFSTNWAVMNMQRYSSNLYRELGDEVDYPMNYNVTGALRLAHSKERMQEFERVANMSRRQGFDLDTMSAEEGLKHFPFMETHELAGVLWDPLDGDMDPAQVTQAFAKGARAMGAKVLRFCPATGAKREGDEWVVSTAKGDIRCEYVVNAAGYYAGEVAKWFNRRAPLPTMVMSHQYIIFETVPEIEAWMKEKGKKLPMIRDVDSSYYLRQENYGMNLGPYERNGKEHWVTADDPMPDDFSFQLFPDDLERIEWYINDAVERVPMLANAGLSKVINGPIPYAPDGLPLIGPMPGVPNAFEASTFTFGICQAGGAGKILSEWITEGQTEWDCWSVDPRRFTAFCDQDYCIAKGLEVYGHEYAMHFPHHEWPAARNKKLSPVHDTLIANGAQMGAYNGWERANWFAQDGDDTSEEATHTWSRNGPWEPRVREECEAVRDACGVLDMPGFSRYNLSGEGAADWLRSKIAGGLPKVGRMNLAYFADERGRTQTEISIIRHEPDHFTLMTAAVAQWHDFELLQALLPTDGSVRLEDFTEDYSTLLVTGPTSREVLSSIIEADFDLPWLCHQRASMGDIECAVARVSFAGELGWEVHAHRDKVLALYAAIRKAGAKPFGMYALNSLRLEKGYRTWKGDLSTDYSLLEGGLGRFIKWDKPDFPGKAALELERQQGSKRSFVTLIVDEHEFDAPYMANILLDGEIVGEVTSCGWGYRVGRCIALGTVDIAAATEGTQLEIDIYENRVKAVVQADQPLWDPENERLRA